MYIYIYMFIVLHHVRLLDDVLKYYVILCSMMLDGAKNDVSKMIQFSIQRSLTWKKNILFCMQQMPTTRSQPGIGPRKMTSNMAGVAELSQLPSRPLEILKSRS